MRLHKLSYLIPVCLLVILIYSGCSEKPPISPVEETGSENFTLETATTIGAQGGTISSEEFLLTIPSGSFKQQTELKLYSKNDNTFFSKEVVTKLFRIEGLPSDFSIPLRIALKYYVTLTNESYIAVSENITDEFTGESQKTHSLLGTVDSSGFLVGYLEPEFSGANILKMNKSNSVDAEDNKYFQALSNYSSELRTDNFKFIYPTSYNEIIPELSSTLEKNYKIIKDSLKLPISKDNNVDGLWKIELYSGEGGISRSSHTLLIIRKDFLEPSLSSEFETRSGQELLNIAVREYYPDNNDYSAADHWLSYSLITWSAELFSSNQNLIWPDDLHPSYTVLENSYSYSAFNGIRYGAGDGFRELYNHAVGMSALFKYLFDNNILMKHQVGEIYNSIKGGENTTHALITAVKQSKDNWWSDFLMHFINGKVYDINNSIFVGNPDGEWSINNDNDSLKEFTHAEIGNYPDFSAKRFLINLNHSTIDESKKLVATAEAGNESEGLSVLVFSQNNSNLEFVGQSTNGISEILNLKDFYNKGTTRFLFVAVNGRGKPPYTNQSNVYLTLKIEESNNKPIACIPTVTIDRVAGITTLQEGDKIEDSQSPFQITGPPYSYIGNFSGNSFTGTWTETIGTSTYTGTVFLQLNDSHNLVTSIKLNREITKNIGGYKNKFNYELEAENIPLIQKDIYEMVNEDVCGKIISVSYKETYNHPTYGFESSFQTPFCDNPDIKDFIRIEFSK